MISSLYMKLMVICMCHTSQPEWNRADTAPLSLKKCAGQKNVHTCGAVIETAANSLFPIHRHYCDTGEEITIDTVWCHQYLMCACATLITCAINNRGTFLASSIILFLPEEFKNGKERCNKGERAILHYQIQAKFCYWEQNQQIIMVLTAQETFKRATLFLKFFYLHRREVPEIRMSTMRNCLNQVCR